jgi:hypothetical protein
MKRIYDSAEHKFHNKRILFDDTHIETIHLYACTDVFEDAYVIYKLGNIQYYA